MLNGYPNCPVELSRPEVEQYTREGFIAFENLLSPDQVQKSKDHLSDLVERAAAEGGVSKNAMGLPSMNIGKFQVQYEMGTDLSAGPADELELKVRKLFWQCAVDPFFDSMARAHERIQGIIQSIIGRDPILFQDMALIKPPFIGSEKPWHQDNAYFSVVPLESVVGVWIALDQATVENGCMHVVPGGHRGGARRHYHDRDCEIVPDRLEGEGVIPVELPPGGAMFFVGMLPHQTPPNRSPHRRRALQYHYRSKESRIVPKTDYDRVFAEADGMPASCAAADKTS